MIEDSRSARKMIYAEDVPANGYKTYTYVRLSSLTYRVGSGIRYRWSA